MEFSFQTRSSIRANDHHTLYSLLFSSPLSKESQRLATLSLIHKKVDPKIPRVVITAKRRVSLTPGRKRLLTPEIKDKSLFSTRSSRRSLRKRSKQTVRQTPFFTGSKVSIKFEIYEFRVCFQSSRIFVTVGCVGRITVGFLWTRVSLC